LLAGCGAEDAFFARLPEPESALSVVFVLESEDAIAIEARAVNKGHVEPVTLDFDRLGRSALWVLYYDRPLSDVGLVSGPVLVRDQGGAPLERPNRVRRTVFLGGELGEWTIEPELSERLRLLEVDRLPSPSPCPSLEQEVTFQLESRAPAAFALRLDGERALLGTDDGRIYVATASGVMLIGVAPMSIESGVLAPNGELIVGSAGGRTFRGTFEPTIELRETERGSSGDAFLVLDGPSTGDSNELFAVTSSGAFEHFDGTTWKTLVEPSGHDWKRGVAWIRPGEGVAVGLVDAIVRAIGDAAAPEEVERTEPFIRVEQVPGIGTFASTLGGALWIDRGDRWEMVPGSPIDLGVSALAPFPGGLVLSGATGQSSVWLSDHGFCERFSVNSPIVKHVAVLDRAVVFLGDARAASTEPTSVTIRTIQ
jgi:hypothetical protein